MRRRLALCALAVLGLAVVGGRAIAAGGEPDTSFNGSGKLSDVFPTGEDRGRAVEALRSGKILVAGSVDAGGGLRDFAIVRLLPNGAPDTTFSGDGFQFVDFGPGADDGLERIAVQRDGRIVLSGASNLGGGNGYEFAAARLRPDGALDNTFSQDGRRTVAFANGVLGDFGGAVVIQPDGKILIAGVTLNLGTNADLGVVRLRPGGALDKSFSGDGRRRIVLGPDDENATDAALRRDGSIVLAGYLERPAPDTDSFALRLRPGGALDKRFSKDGIRLLPLSPDNDVLYSVAIDGRGRLVLAGAAGNFVPVAGAVVRLRPGGAFDPAFSQDGRRFVPFGDPGRLAFLDAVVDGRGRIVAAGVSGQSAVLPDFTVVRLRPGGASDTSFSQDGLERVSFGATGEQDTAYDVDLDRRGRILLAGETDTGPEYRTSVARLLP